MFRCLFVGGGRIFAMCGENGGGNGRELGTDVPRTGAGRAQNGGREDREEDVDAGVLALISGCTLE